MGVRYPGAASPSGWASQSPSGNSGTTRHSKAVLYLIAVSAVTLSNLIRLGKFVSTF
jgi:hypothetical protein